jgi:hypothetical protein
MLSAQAAEEVSVNRIDEQSYPQGYPLEDPIIALTSALTIGIVPRSNASQEPSPVEEVVIR